MVQASAQQVKKFSGKLLLAPMLTERWPTYQELNVVMKMKWNGMKTDFLTVCLDLRASAGIRQKHKERDHLPKEIFFVFFILHFSTLGGKFKFWMKNT